MKTLFLLIFCFMLSGCCIRPNRNEPSYPKNAQLGWREKGTEKKKISGHFVLKKGEHTEYGGLRVEVTDIIDNNCIGASESNPIFAKLKFTKTAEQKIMCEDARVETSAGLISSSCEWLREFGIEFIGVRAINVRENWVDFEFRSIE